MAESAPQQSLPQPGGVTESVDRDDPAVRSAVNFLKDSRMRLASAESKIRFLKQKGLSPSQIKFAFDQAGQSVSMEKIIESKAAPSLANTSGSPASAILSAAPVSAPASPPPQRVASLRANSGLPARTHTLYPATPYVPEPEQQSTWDWRDVVIGAGAAAIAVVGGAKLFQRYSPYELRRKDDRGSPMSATAARRQQFGRGPHQHQRRSNAVFSSDTDAERGFLHRSNGSAAPGDAPPVGAATYPLRQPAPPLPPAPAAPPADAAAAAAAAVAAAAATVDREEEVKRLEKELADAKESLVAERKRNAELSLSVAKIRNEKQQLSHKNDKLSLKVDDLEEQLKRLEEKEKSLAEGEKEEGEREEGAERAGAAAEEAAGEAAEDKDDNAEPSAPQQPPADPVSEKTEDPAAAPQESGTSAAPPIAAEAEAADSGSAAAAEAAGNDSSKDGATTDIVDTAAKAG